MNGIIIKKKKLNERQLKRLCYATSQGKAKQWCIENDVSFPTMKSAKVGNELSEQIIDKIIKAL